MSFNEKEFSVRGLRLRAKHWHENAPHKVIALHGWLDNAASFDVLAHLLPECSIAALDLAGQGFSEHRPPSATYHLWDDLVDILDIADQLGWQRFSVIGHSRGGMLAIMLAASVSERVERIILLDALMPAPVEPGNAPQQLRRHLLESRPRESRWFASREQAIAVRARASAIPEAVAEMLASRQLCQSVQGWFWKIDERLKAASALKLSAEHNRAFLAAVQCPATVILASGGWLAPYWQQLARDYPQFSWHVLDGHHHLHMDQQAGEVACLCLRV